MKSLKLALPILIFTIAGGWFLWQDADIDIASLFTNQVPAKYNSPYIIPPTPAIKPSDQVVRTPPQYQPPINEPLRRPSVDDVLPVPTTTATDAPTMHIVGTEPNYDRKIIERVMGDAVNRQRLNRGLNKLKWRKDLARVGRKFSREQVVDTQKLIDAGEQITTVEIRHTGETFGATPIARINSKDIYDFSLAGENIISLPLLRKTDENTYAWRTISDIADDSSIRWIASPGHRKNIIIPTYTHTGIGVVRVGNFLIATQLFIAKVSCGYNTGKCCKPDDTHPVGFCYGDNICAKQDDDEMKCEAPE